MLSADDRYVAEQEDALMHRYYPLLDPVRFASTRSRDEVEHSTATAMRQLLEDLLVNGLTPVLSAVQAFDNQMLLSLVGQENEDSAAVLRLMRAGRIQVRLPTMSKGCAGPLQPTLITEFQARLSTKFRFSAWPELADPDVRQTVRAILSGRNREPLEDSLQVRLDALRLMDQQCGSLHSPPSGPTSVERLSQRVTMRLSRADQATIVTRTWTDLQLFLRRSGPSYNLDLRSDWHRLLEDFAQAQGRAVTRGVVATIRAVVDLQYNIIVARSLGANDFTDEVPTSTANAAPPSGALAAEAPQMVLQESRLEQLGSMAHSLRWSDALVMLPDLEVLSPAGRVRWLHRAGFVDGDTPAHTTWRLNLGNTSLHHVALESAAAVTAAAVGGAIGGLPGAVTGAVVEVGVRNAARRETRQQTRASRRQQSWLLRTKARA